MTLIDESHEVVAPEATSDAEGSTAHEPDVPPLAVAEPPASPESVVVKSFLKGAFIGSVIVFVVCGGIALLAGAGWGPAVGIGSFSAFWGGPGFGGMLGAVVGFMSISEH